MDVGVHLEINMEWGTVSEFGGHVSHLLFGSLCKVYGTYVQF